MPLRTTSRSTPALAIAGKAANGCRSAWVSQHSACASSSSAARRDGAKASSISGYVAMQDSSIGLVQDVVRRARRAGAEEAEAYFQEIERTRIELRDQQVESLASAATRGVGLRVLVDGAGSYVYTTELRSRGLGELARRAVALAREAAPDPDRTLPDLAQA